MHRILKATKEESGQSIILFAILMAVLLGFAAFTIDIGYAAYQKSDLQNAADSAALAGAMSIPSLDDDGVEQEVEKYVDLNLASDASIDEIAIDRTEGTVYVELSQPNPKFLSGVISNKSHSVHVKAKAKNKSMWGGEALPFVNLAYDYSTEDPTTWTDVGSGIKFTITDFYTKGNGSGTYFEIDYVDGITITPGFDNGAKGLDFSTLKVGIEEIISKEYENVKKFYLFSLRADIIQSGEFTVNNKTKTVSLDKLNKLNNNDVIDPEQLVLIECLYLTCKYSNYHDIELQFLNNVFDLGYDDPENPLPDFPTEHLSSNGTSKLVE